jgi:hypothetical protein
LDLAGGRKLDVKHNGQTGEHVHFDSRSSIGWDILN